MTKNYHRAPRLLFPTQVRVGLLRDQSTDTAEPGQDSVSDGRPIKRVFCLRLTPRILLQKSEEELHDVHG
jgi:hypothetical protein